MAHSWVSKRVGLMCAVTGPNTTYPSVDVNTGAKHHSSLPAQITLFSRHSDHFEECPRSAHIERPKPPRTITAIT